MTADVIPLHADQAPQGWELVDAGELARLRQIEADLSRPYIELARDLAHARRVREEAEHAMHKVAEHEHRGYQKIRVGAFTALRAVLNEER